MTSEEIYLRLKILIEEFPEFPDQGPIPGEKMQWLGRADALVRHYGDPTDRTSFRAAVTGLDGFTRGTNLHIVTSILYALLARAEIDAPATTVGGFLPVAAPAAALAAVARVFGTADKSLLIIDPYASAVLLLDFCVTAHEMVQIDILTSNKGMKPDLLPAHRRWMQQYGAARPVQIRTVSDGSLHDRVAIIDCDKLFIIGQSFNALATRSPTYISEIGPEIKSMKMQAYVDIWQRASPL